VLGRGGAQQLRSHNPDHRGPAGGRARTGIYVDDFFDVIDEGASHEWRDLSTYTPAKVAELENVQSLLLDA
jgi:hypothetical protein